MLSRLLDDPHGPKQESSKVCLCVTCVYIYYPDVIRPTQLPHLSQFSLDLIFLPKRVKISKFTHLVSKSQ